MDQPADAPERPPRQEPRSLKAMDWRSAGAAPSPSRTERPRDTSKDDSATPERSQRGNFSRSVGNWRSANPSPRDTSSPSRSYQKPPRDGPPQGQRWRERSSNAEGAKDAPPTSTFRNSNSDRAAKASLVDDSSALQEGRRIYLGNILYHVRPDEITQALEREGFKNYEQIHISIDPVSGRNPGYCFVEFDDRETADRAIDALSGVEIHGRALKTGPCNPKTSRGPRRDGGGGGGGGRGAADGEDYEPTFNRWGDFSGGKHGASLGKSGPDAAQEHLAETLDDYQRTRLYVGGLGKMINQEHNDKELREIFSGFKVKAISKRITANANTRSLPGAHNFCFVDFETHEEANRARKAINGIEYLGTKLRVNPAKHNAPATIEHSAAVHDLAEEFLGRRVEKDGP